MWTLTKKVSRNFGGSGHWISMKEMQKCPIKFTYVYTGVNAWQCDDHRGERGWRADQRRARVTSGPEASEGDERTRGEWGGRADQRPARGTNGPEASERDKRTRGQREGRADQRGARGTSGQWIWEDYQAWEYESVCSLWQWPLRYEE